MFFNKSLFLDSGNERTVGGGSAKPVARQWSDFLQSGLETGTYSPKVDPGNRFGGKQSPMFGPKPVGGNPTGGIGAPMIDPAQGPNQTMGGIPDLINRYLNGTGTNVGNQGMIDKLATPTDPMQFQFQGQTGAGPSVNYQDAMSQLFGLAGKGSDLVTQFSNPGNMPAGPGGYTPGAFSSEGIVGDRGNVSSAISNYFNRATQDNLADTRARLTASGGMSAGTPAAYAAALTNVRGGEALAKALADADLGYRNHDLGAYQALQQAIVGNRGVDATNYGNQLDFLGRGQTNSLSGLGQIGNMLSNIMGSEFNQQQLGEQELARLQSGQMGTNQLNLNSALGFGDLNSRNLTNASNMMFNNAQLGQQGQMNVFQQMMQAYMQQAGLGTPQANTVMEPGMFGQAMNVAGNFLPMLAGAPPGAGGINPASYATTPQMAPQQFTPLQLQPIWTPGG